MQHITNITSYIRMLRSSSQFHLLLVHGPAGWGKSSLTRQVLTGLGVSYELLGSYSTPLGLFNMLVEHPDGLLVVDDTAGLFENASAMAILNAATWPGSDAKGGRRVMWTSTTKKAAAAEVIFTGKIIALTNYVPESPQGKAFKNRALNYQITINTDDVGRLLTAAAQSHDHFANTQIATLVATFLGEEARRRKTDEISFRTLQLGYELAMDDRERWQDLLLAALPSGQPKSVEELVLDLATSGLSVERQAMEFASQTSLGRRKFFYLRQQLGLTTETRSSAQRVAALARPSSKRASSKASRAVQ